MLVMSHISYLTHYLQDQFIDLSPIPKLKYFRFEFLTLTSNVYKSRLYKSFLRHIWIWIISNLIYKQNGESYNGPIKSRITTKRVRKEEETAWLTACLLTTLRLQFQQGNPSQFPLTLIQKTTPFIHSFIRPFIRSFIKSFKKRNVYDSQ